MFYTPKRQIKPTTRIHKKSTNKAQRLIRRPKQYFSQSIIRLETKEKEQTNEISETNQINELHGLNPASGEESISPGESFSFKMPIPKHHKMIVQYNCQSCDGLVVKKVTKRAYYEGVVIIECPHCKTRQLIVDNIGWLNGDHSTWDMEQESIKKGGNVIKLGPGFEESEEFKALPEINRKKLIEMYHAVQEENEQK